MDKKELSVKLYNEGKSTLYIAKELGVSDWSVREWLKKAGVKMRKRNTRKYSIDDNFLDSLGEHQAYFIGYMITDGSVSDRFGTFSFRCSKEDRQLIEDLLAVLKSNYPIRTYGNAITVELRSEKIRQKLNDYGIIPNKTLTARVPKLPKSVWIPFIRGVIDGDGSIGFYEYKGGTKYTIRITSGSEIFLKGIQEMINELYGEKGSLIKTKGNVHVLAFQSKSFVLKFLGDLYENSTIHLGRKRCMSVRGVKKHGSSTITTALRGEIDKQEVISSLQLDSK